MTFDVALLHRAKTPGEILQAARGVDAAIARDAPVVAVLSTFNAELSRPRFVVEAARAGLGVRIFTAPYGQPEQLVLDRSSVVWRDQPPAALVLLVRLSDVDPTIAHVTPGAHGDGAARVARIRDRVLDLARAAREQMQNGGPILVANFALETPAPDVFDAGDPDSLAHVVAEANRELARGLRKIADAHVFDYQAVVARVGLAHFDDAKLTGMARALGSVDAQAAVGAALARELRGVLTAPKKCLVLDLDNTLWGGVIGDDGIAGIKLGDDAPGIFYKRMQQALLGYAQRGVLLAVCSKNDDATARDVFRNHREMVLRESDIAAWAVSWEPKPHGVRQIAKALNIGLDSLVFVDDNPVERASVQAELPMVDVIDLPPDPSRYVAALLATPGLDRARRTDEDASRLRLVAEDRVRSGAEQAAPSLAAFLAQLDMRAEVGLADEHTLERVHQLVQKTNQWNLTTVRHEKAALLSMAKSNDAAVAYLRLADRFGDLGLVCVGVVTKTDGDTWEIDTLLMSCRVMGRGVEDAFLAYLFEICRARDAGRGGARVVRGVYAPTEKNGPVANFYATHGFRAVSPSSSQPSSQSSQASVFERDIDDMPAWPSTITRVAAPSSDAKARSE